MADQISISKAQALAAYENNPGQLAKALGVFVQAVYQWPDDKPIPEKQALRLRYVLKPDYPWDKPAPRVAKTKRKAA